MSGTRRHGVFKMDSHIKTRPQLSIIYPCGMIITVLYLYGRIITEGDVP